MRVQDIRSSLGLAGINCAGQWTRDQKHTTGILGREGLLGSPARAEEFGGKKLAVAKQLEVVFPDIFYRIPSFEARRSTIYEFLSLRMQGFLESMRKSYSFAPTFGATEKIVVIITTPSVPSFRSHLLRTDLIIDGKDSIDRLYEILREDGLNSGRLKYIKQASSGGLSTNHKRG